MFLIKAFLVCGLVMTSLFTVGAVATTGYVLTGGFAHVSVDAPDVDLSLPVPLRLADLGLAIASHAAPTEALDELRSGLDTIAPSLDRLARELADFPEGEIVRVVDGDTHVLVAQQGGRFLVEVETDDADIKVSLPRRSAGRILRGLADL